MGSQFVNQFDCVVDPFAEHYIPPGLNGVDDREPVNGFFCPFKINHDGPQVGLDLRDAPHGERVDLNGFGSRVGIDDP